MIPWLILAVVAVPLVVLGYLSTRRRIAGGEQPAAEDAEARARTEREFSEAEAYEERWREENADQPRPRIP